jgi:hypothetical protein
MEEAAVLHYLYTRIPDLISSVRVHCGCHYASKYASKFFMNKFDHYVVHQPLVCHSLSIHCCTATGTSGIKSILQEGNGSERM